MLIASPRSSLFERPEDARRILDASDALEVRHAAHGAEVDGTGLFHCELSLVAPWNRDEAGEIGAAASAVVDAGGRLEVVSFHLASRYVRNRVEGGAFVGEGDPMTREAMLAHAARNALLARESCPGANLLVENNNHLGTDAYELVTDPGFIGDLAAHAGVGLLLDVAHARITARNTGVDERDYLMALPLGSVRQVHLSRHGSDGARAWDAHEPLDEHDWRYFKELRPLLPDLRYVTIEYYRDADALLAQLARLRSILGDTST